MSKGTEREVSEVRQRIDGVDRQIVELIAERQKWVLKAGSLKSGEPAVRAPDRVEQVIGKVRSLDAESGASPEIVEATYRALIGAFIDLELDIHNAQG